ncbi:hypothetical protein PMAYCL1PPCAC_13844, partial [Pristionchus mayeri]
MEVDEKLLQGTVVSYRSISGTIPYRQVVGDESVRLLLHVDEEVPLEIDHIGVSCGDGFLLLFLL